MRVLITFLSFAEDVFGGIENSIFNLCLGLKELQHEVLVYTSTLGDSGQTVGPIDTVRRPELLPLRLPRGNAERDVAIRTHLTTNTLSLRRDLEDLIEARGIDVIIACDPLWGIVDVIELWEDTRCPIILSHHVRGSAELMRTLYDKPYLFHRFVSRTLYEDMEPTFRSARVEIIPNSIDQTLHYPAPSDRPTSRILFCNSRMDDGKGIEYLLHAMALLRADGLSFELLLCGGESPFGNRDTVIGPILQSVKHLQIDECVRILGNLRWRDIPSYIRAAFAVVLPSVYESFGRAALEGMACGVPVVAAMGGNLPHLVGDAGLLVPAKSSKELRDGIRMLYYDPEMQRRLSAAGRERAAQYSNAAVARRFIDAIEERI